LTIISASSARILVVEDESVIAMLLEDQLEELGYSPLGPAANVAEALSLLAKETPDAALLDVNLGNEVSYPVAVALNAAGIPYIFITGYGATGLSREFCERPVLAKPFTSASLEATLATVLRRPAE